MDKSKCFDRTKRLEEINALIKKLSKHNSLENIQLLTELRKEKKTIVHRLTKINKKNCPKFKLTERIRKIISFYIKTKSIVNDNKIHKILGCSFIEFKKHLESKMEPWMNWDNKGKYNGQLNYGWDIDHIIPISTAKTEEDIIRLNHYTNLQPLCSYTNRNIKKNKINVITNI